MNFKIKPFKLQFTEPDGAVGGATGGTGYSPILNTVIGAVAGLIDSAITNSANKDIAEDNRNFSASEAEKARNWQEEQYRKYSSPSALVRQYEEAGLNPALVAGQGQGVTFSGSTAHSPQTFPYQGIGLDALITLIPTLAKLQIDREIADSEINRNNAAADKDRADAEGRNIDNQFKPKLLQQQLDQGELDIQNTEKGLTLLSERINTEKTIQELNKDELLNNAVNRLVGMRTADKILEETNTEVLKQVTERLRAENLSVDTQSKAAGIIRLQVQNYVDCATLVLKSDEVRANVRRINADALEQEIDNKYYQKYGYKPQSGLYGTVMQILMNIPESGEKLLNEVGKGIKYLNDHSDPTYIPNNK